MYANSLPVFTDALSRGRRVVVTSILPWGATVGWSADKQSKGDDYGVLLQAWAAANGMPFVSLASMGGQGGNPYVLQTIYDSGDGLHPNAAGAAEIARLVSLANP
jgi:hypothetical protein